MARPGGHHNGDRLFWSVAPEATLSAVKVFNQHGSDGSEASGNHSQIIRGLDWVREQGIHIANMSFGTPEEPEEALARAIAATAEQTALVASVGNDGPTQNTCVWPARYPEVIGVGAVDSDKQIAEFSSRGAAGGNVEVNVELVGPGVDVESNRLGGGQQDLVKMSGTSMACPSMVGVLALLQQKYPTMRGTMGLRSRIRASSIEDLGPTGPDDVYGLGLGHIHLKS
jgi:subtilisin